MRRFKRFAAAALAAVMSVAMLTACGGGGGGGGVTPVTPAASVKGTKTYKLAQDGKGKSLYMEYWNADTDEDTGKLEEDKDTLMKVGMKDGCVYVDSCTDGVLEMTEVAIQGKEYMVSYPGTDTYDYYMLMVDTGEAGSSQKFGGENVYVDLAEVVRVMGKASTGGFSGSSASIKLDMIDDSKVTVSTGTFTTPDKSHTYYAEIFTMRADPTVSVTFAYDDEDNLKACVDKDSDGISAMLFTTFEFDSLMFNEAKLNIDTYNATDITEEFIKGYKKAYSGRH